MKAKLFLILFTLLSFYTLNSCTEDEDGGYAKLANQENIVVVKIYSNTIDVPISLGNGLIIKNYWEGKYNTKEYYTQMTARCADPTVLMTGEIYINGALKVKKEANSYLEIGYRIKGDGY